MKISKQFIRKSLWALIALFGLVIVFFGFIFLYLESQLPDVETLKDVRMQVPLRVYSADNQLIAEFGEKKRIPVTYEEVPKDLVYAVLATEDQRFFDHPGVDIFGLGRAAVELIRTGSKTQGGSTITMQVARNFFLTRKKTFLRKFNEILLAIKIDNELSKDKILELYLNKIYLGNRAYGVAAAAHVYYGKSLNELTLPQLAMIAGLPKAPSKLNPLANPEAAKKRRNHVLSRLFSAGYITEQAYTEAIEAPITAEYHGVEIKVDAPYVAEMIRQAVYDYFGKDAYTHGYQVYTTIDSRMQQKANNALMNGLINYEQRHGYRGPAGNIGDPESLEAEQLLQKLKNYETVNGLIPAVVTTIHPQSLTVMMENSQYTTIAWNGLSWARSQLANGHLGTKPTYANQIVQLGDVIYIRKMGDNWQLTQIPEVEGALVALNPHNGAILALVGGFSFHKSKYNRVTQANRQPGSSFKPFIYAAGLEKGMTLATIINDAPVVMEDPSIAGFWRPQNSNRRFHGPTRLRSGLTHSLNLVSIRLLELVGIDYTIEFLHRLGFETADIPRTLSLALGSLTITPLELSAGYAIFANGGYKVDPFVILKITDAHGEPVLQSKPKIACPDCENSHEPRVAPEQQASQVLSSQIAYLINLALRDVIAAGTGRLAKSLNRADLAGKTGTTNDLNDAWFAGYNPNLVTTVWVGYDQLRSLKEYSSKAALPIWIDFMGQALRSTPVKQMPMPPGLITVRIDPETGLLANDYQQKTRFETFRKDHVPARSAPINDAHAPPYRDDVQDAEPIF